ncbi:unnamed protein product [Rhizoctonia solani]|nr:unnamed protein product [Rhizoctonia solani]
MASMTSWNLPPWDQQTFSFGWTPYVHTMQQCSNLKILFDTDLGSPALHANPPPAPPYTVIVYTSGYQPLTLAVGNIGKKGTYSWIVNLPLGPMYMLAMKDSAGYTGGSALTLITDSQCGNVDYVVNNGTSPFQVEIIPEVRQQKTLHFETNRFGFVLDLPAGLSFFVAITDANGNSAVDGILIVGTSNDNTCLNAAATVSVGVATSIYTGSGSVLPMTTSTTSGYSSTTSQQSSTTDRPHISNGSKATSAKVPIIVSVVAGVTVIFVLSILYCIYRRQRRRATSRPVGKIQQYQYDTSPNDPHAYRDTLSYQYPSTAVPEIQTPEPHLYAAKYHIPRHLFEDAYINQTNLSNATSVSRPQSFKPRQTILSGHNSSPDQSPYTTRFSQNTGLASTSLGGVVARQSLDAATTEMRHEDKKQRVSSPGLPPGAMPPASPGPHEQSWDLKAPGTPGSSNVHSVPRRSPPPRSGASTALPPYESTEGIIEH